MSMTRLVTLRPGGARDLPQVDRVMQIAFDPRFGEAWTMAQCSGILTLPGVWMTLAEMDDALAGFALSRSTLDDGELLLLAVDPAKRRAGVGAHLLRATIDEAKDRGVTSLHLEVRSGNPAITLYKQSGFTNVGKRPNYYCGKDGSQYDALTFQRTIA